MTSTPPPNWQPSGTAAGKTAGEAMKDASAVFTGAAAGIAGQRHYEATEDAKIAAIAASRAALRWGLFFWTVFISVCYLGAIALSFVYFAFATAQGGADNFALGITVILGPIAALFSFPYGLGVLWVRFADRSLFRVNRWGIYKALAPFAHRVRNLPDAILWLSPPLLWSLGSTVGWFVGQFITLAT